jgi:hypothetical protein
MRNFTITKHCAEQAEAYGIAMTAIHNVLASPALTYGSFTKVDGERVPRRCNKCGTQQQKWTGESQGHKVCLAVNVCCGVVVTIWKDQVDTDLRPDQRAKGVTYIDRQGRRRS